MATIVYLDAEDEITSAAARIRAAADSRVGLVLPFGSRVATSRINFRLLAREAMSHGRRLDIVAPDASARALAASAGLPVFASVGEYEEALDTEDDEKDARRAASRAAAGLTGGAAVVGGAAVAGGSAAATPAEPRGAAASSTGGAERDSGGVRSSGAKARSGSSARPAAVAAAAAAPGTADLSDTDLYDAPGAVGASTARSPDALPLVHDRRRGRRLGAIVGTLLVLVVVVGAIGVGAYLLLPSASITVRPRIEDLGPVTFKVRADPTATSVDEVAGIVPAVTLTVPVETQSEFPATGKRVEKHPAKGAVKWTNCDPTSPYRIPSGTIVKTASGTAFTTDEEVFLPVAILSGGGASPSLDCQSSEVAVTAVVSGPDGNVDAGTIRVVPPRYNSNVLRVNNPAPTTGGTREEFTRVSQKDVDAALVKLNADLQAQFATEVRHPSDVPEGTTPFPGTAVLGESTPSVDPTTLIGQEVDSFTLGVSADGTVLAADASPAEAIGEQRLQASVAEGRELVPGSTSVEIGDGTVVDGRIEFPVTASATQVRPLDAAALERTVLGLPIEQAKAALQPYGEVVIDPWPSWVTSVPSLEQRVILTVGQPVEAASPGASPVPSDAPGSSSLAVPAGTTAGALRRGPGGEPVPSAG